MLKKILLGIVLNALALYAVTEFVSDIHYTGGLKFFIIGGIVIGFFNTFVKPLMKILSFPIIFFTLGLFSLVINIIIFWLTVKGINAIHYADVSVNVNTATAYIWAALFFAIINWVLHVLIRNK